MDSNFIIDGQSYPISPDGSGIRASIDSKANGSKLSVEVFVEAVVNEHPEFTAMSASVIFSPWDGLRDGWETLANHKCKSDSQEMGVSAIENDCTSLYLGWHLDCSDHLIQVGPFENFGFAVEWTFTAKEDPDDPAILCAVSTWLPITEVKIIYPELFEEIRQKHKNDSPEKIDEAFSALEIDIAESLEIIQSMIGREPLEPPSRLRWGLKFPYSQLPG